MQKFLEWLDDHNLLDPLESALSIVGVILYGIWCLALAVAAIVFTILAIGESGWWLLAFIPWLVLLIVTITVYFYIDNQT